MGRLTCQQAGESSVDNHGKGPPEAIVAYRGAAPRSGCLE